VSVCLCVCVCGVCVCVYMCVCVLAQNNTVYHFASFFNHLQVITRLCALPLPHSLTISGSSLSCVLCLCKILEQSQAHHSLVCSASAKFFNNLKRITLLCALSLQHTGENTDHGLCKIFKHTQGTTQTTASAKFLNNLECITLLCALFLQHTGDNTDHGLCKILKQSWVHHSLVCSVSATGDNTDHGHFATHRKALDSSQHGNHLSLITEPLPMHAHISVPGTCVF